MRVIFVFKISLLLDFSNLMDFRLSTFFFEIGPDAPKLLNFYYSFRKVCRLVLVGVPYFSFLVVLLFKV